jgi:ELWxxDGT repeat protein
MNGIAYFVADDGIHGTELWRSDTTAAGTYLLKDINAGSTSSYIQNITVAGSKLFFTVYIYSSASYKLYVSDGTAAGTKPVAVLPRAAGDFAVVGSTLYFVTGSGAHYSFSQLWKSNGTAAGTVMVADFNTASFNNSDGLGQLTNAGGTLYFTVANNSVYGAELWKSDGSAAGTVLVKDIYSGSYGSNPSYLTVVNNKLYFAAEGALFYTDGTAAGTAAVINNAGAYVPYNYYSNSYFNYYNAPPLAVMGNILYFEAWTGTTGYELYAYNTTNSLNGIYLVKDINT